MSRALFSCLALALAAASGCGDDSPITHPDLAVEYDLAVRDLTVPADLTAPTWRVQDTPVIRSLYAIYGAAGDIFAVGDRGVVVHTIDNGAHWEQQQSDTSAALFGVWTDGTIAIAVGYNGTVVRSVDHGETWQATTVGSATLRTVFGANVGGDGGDALQLWVVGEGGTVLQSNDTGLTWNAVANSAGGDVRGVWASSAEAFVVGDNLVRTRDDGASWTQLLTGVVGVGVWASGSGQLVYARSGGIYRSRDGGLSWNPLPIGEAAGDIIGFAAFGNGELWAARAGGAIRRIVNDFDDAVPADDADVGHPLQAIWGSDPGNLFVVGDNGFVAHRH